MIATAACSSTPQPKHSTASTQANKGSVAIFTPSDGVTLSDHKPLNTWTKLTPEIQSALIKNEGFEKTSISATTSDTLDAQSRAIQDYVVGHITSTSSATASSSSASGSSSAHTLIVAPVVSNDSMLRQYGDFVNQALSWQSKPSDSSSSSSGSSHASPSASSSSSSATSSPSPTQSTQSADTNTTQDSKRIAGERLVAALRLAQDSGMHVILISHSVQGYTPDLFVNMSTAREIGIIQAKQLVSKLELNATSAENPKHIEVMIPVSSSTLDDSDASTSADSDAKAAGDVFAKEAFSGIWSVLQSYYRDGRVTSPSHTLTASSTDASWNNVTFDASKDNSVQTTLATRLGKTAEGQDVPVSIHGILAMNDYVASGVISQLQKLGYTGSSSDINPQISISGIVGNITGKHDIQKDRAPDPKRAPKESTGDDDQASGTAGAEKISSAWPIVTGFGSYLDTIPSIVDGLQWMTALESRKSIATDIAKAAALFDSGKGVNSMDDVSSQTINNVKVASLHVEAMVVSASNMKATLLDKNYITPAEAGL